MPSHIANFEIGLRRVLKASFISRGLSDQAANAKVEQKLGLATKKFYVQLSEHEKRADLASAAKYAMRDVIAWAKTL